MKKQTWNILNADKGCIAVYFCDTLEQAYGKAKLAFGDDVHFLTIEKGEELDIEMSRRVIAWDANRYSLAFIKRNIDLAVIKRKADGSHKFSMFDSIGSIGSVDGFLDWFKQNGDAKEECFRVSTIEEFMKLIEPMAMDSAYAKLNEETRG